MSCFIPRAQYSIEYSRYSLGRTWPGLRPTGLHWSRYVSRQRKGAAFVTDSETRSSSTPTTPTCQTSVAPSSCPARHTSSLKECHTHIEPGCRSDIGKLSATLHLHKNDIARCELIPQNLLNVMTCGHRVARRAQLAPKEHPELASMWHIPTRAMRQLQPQQILGRRITRRHSYCASVHHTARCSIQPSEPRTAEIATRHRDLRTESYSKTGAAEPYFF